MAISSVLAGPAAPAADWQEFYAALQVQGRVPDAAAGAPTAQLAVFRGMALSLADLKNQLKQANLSPALTVIYADVLVIAPFANWRLETAGLVIIARRLEITGPAAVQLDYQHTPSSRLVVFAQELVGSLTVIATHGSQPATSFSLGATEVAPGASIGLVQGRPVLQALTLAQGLGLELAEDFRLYLRNTFLYASLLYDQYPALARAQFAWVADWAAQQPELAELFYRSVSLATLLQAQLGAAADGATFVPYLATGVYAGLAAAYGTDVAAYESSYQHLSTQQVVTETGISAAQALVATSQSEQAYVASLLQQAEANYANAVSAAEKARRNFETQERLTEKLAGDFRLGIKEYQFQQTLKAIGTLVQAVVTFGAGIASMVVSGGATAPAAATGAVSSATAVAQAAGTATEVATAATGLAASMEKLKQLAEVLQKVYTLAQTVQAVASSLSSAASQTQAVQALQQATAEADLRVVDAWAVFGIQANNILRDPIEREIQSAAPYQEALDILVVYGQALAAAQLAAIQAGQQVAAITFQQHYARQKQAHLQGLVAELRAGQAPRRALMQQLYQRYLDGKSSLFAALKSYEAAYFYWALRPSTVRPRLTGPVSQLQKEFSDLTNVMLDEVRALEAFDPPPQVMVNVAVELTEPAILEQLRKSGQTTWVLPLDHPVLAGLDRVRATNVRVWLEGARVIAPATSIAVTITTPGNYLDRYRGRIYRFTSRPLTRTFRYRVAGQGQGADWHFADGTLGFVQVDGSVEEEMAYAYFRPTPFSEWGLAVPVAQVDCSQVSKITLCFSGSAIGATPAGRRMLQADEAAPTR